jgi:phosphate transport system ATP-binding protein
MDTTVPMNPAHFSNEANEASEASEAKQAKEAQGLHVKTEAQAESKARAEAKLEVVGLGAWFGRQQVLRGISLVVRPRSVLAVIGPSGCGKSTFIRCINRLHELTPGARVEGRLLLEGQDLYAPGVDPVELRRRVGMVFQRPNVFPTMSIRDNVLAGLKLNGIRGDHDAIVEDTLRRTALWDEVKDRLDDSPMRLSGGQQQRLCIARAIAVEPEVLLMDEPASALDPIATARIEELIDELKERYTIIIVTHNMQQAVRVSDDTAFFYLGELIEVGETRQIFTTPRESRTEDYVTGKFG